MFYHEAIHQMEVGEQHAYRKKGYISHYAIVIPRSGHFSGSGQYLQGLYMNLQACANKLLVRHVS